MLNLKSELNFGVNAELYKKFSTTVNSAEIGFFHLPANKTYIKESQDLAANYKNKKNIYLIGIGGSSLGPKMLVDALKKNSRQFYFLENIDSTSISDVVANIHFEDSLFYVVSKSGTTPETLAVLNIITNEFLKQKFSLSDLAKHFVFCSEKNQGDLFKIATQYKIPHLEIPLNIGGRFSVLSHVGLFPAALAGLDLKQLLQGAQELAEIISNKKEKAPIFQVATFLHQNYLEQRNQTVIMNYSNKLKTFNEWFVQLWAESLGKKQKGFTPVTAVGTTDQHSVLQLFAEGPDNKSYLFIDILNRPTDLKLTSPFPTEKSQQLGSYSLNQLYQAAFAGTLKSLQEKNRPLIHMQLEKLDEFNLGSLIFWFECLTTINGQLLEIDPFNQPGVEASKKYAWEWLNNSRR
ncbi:MAG: hypothetical protein JNM93_07865 [Bacteriovoracaceae bacterium]|nr:hypothetical protein [Bacteriovoracaceae bacterium]